MILINEDGSPVDGGLVQIGSGAQLVQDESSSGAATTI